METCNDCAQTDNVRVNNWWVSRQNSGNSCAWLTGRFSSFAKGPDRALWAALPFGNSSALFFGSCRASNSQADVSAGPHHTPSPLAVCRSLIYENECYCSILLLLSLPSGCHWWDVRGWDQSHGTTVAAAAARRDENRLDTNEYGSYHICFHIFI
jgi:hypothetical protein